MNDDDWGNSLLKASQNKGWSYHEICKWLPYKPETIDDIAADISAHGYRQDRPIILFEGCILDGRHRYEAALKAGVDPIFVEFQGSRCQAIDYVTSENVSRRHLNNREKEYFYVQRANALGVQSRGGNGNNQYQSGNAQNFALAPSQDDHADAIGVSRRTVQSWEKDRKEIKADPELSEKANTFEGFVEAKKELQKRRKATKEEAERISKLMNLRDGSKAEAEAANRKLDKLRDQGIDVDAVKSQKDIDNEREAYHRAQKPIDEMANAIAQVLVDTKDYKAIAAIVKAAYPRDGELERAYELLTTE